MARALRCVSRRQARPKAARFRDESHARRRVDVARDAAHDFSRRHGLFLRERRDARATGAVDGDAAGGVVGDEREQKRRSVERELRGARVRRESRHVARRGAATVSRISARAV